MTTGIRQIIIEGWKRGRKGRNEAKRKGKRTKLLTTEPVVKKFFY
jgi:hypothetical protein